MTREEFEKIRDEKISTLPNPNPRLAEVLDMMIAEDRVSIAFIQRKFSLGYPAAAQIMEALTECGLVDYANAKVLLTYDK